jgi:hypothetical protein
MLKFHIFTVFYKLKENKEKKLEIEGKRSEINVCFSSSERVLISVARLDF